MRRLSHLSCFLPWARNAFRRGRIQTEDPEREGRYTVDEPDDKDLLIDLFWCFRNDIGPGLSVLERREAERLAWRKTRRERRAEDAEADVSGRRA